MQLETEIVPSMMQQLSDLGDALEGDDLVCLEANLDSMVHTSKKHFCRHRMSPSVPSETPWWRITPPGHQYHTLHCISPSDCSLTVPSCCVGLLFTTNTLALWPTVTMHRNEFIGYAPASVLQCDGWYCENVSSGSFYLCTKCNSLCPIYTHRSKSPYVCDYWQSITHSVHLMSYN